jgi:glycogen debranching enzyme
LEGVSGLEGPFNGNLHMDDEPVGLRQQLYRGLIRLDARRDVSGVRRLGAIRRGAATGGEGQQDSLWATHFIERTHRRSYDDLGALRIEDPNHPERIIVAAGAPWFTTLFGHDSLWASEMAVVNPVSEEEPGKILHEVRLDVSSGLYIGRKAHLRRQRRRHSAFRDDTGTVSRWGFAKDDIAALRPHADRALGWIWNYGDKDGDGAAMFWL